MEFLEFIKNAVTQYHATKELANILEDAGYERLYEEEEFKVEKGKKYYVTRNNSSILAFQIPNDFDSINIVASHTDSPTFKLKPNFKLEVDSKYTMLNTEVYGGPIYSSFFDRPLSLAGRAFVKNGSKIKEELVNVDKDLLVIPNECIHFNREVNDGKKYNAQIDLLPLLGNNKACLYELLEKELKCKKEDILSFDLQLYSRYRGSKIGANNEYFMAPQIDNLESAFATLEGFIKAKNDYSLNVYASFDNEEVGSRTKQGAGSKFMQTTLERIYKCLGLSMDKLYQDLANGLLVSCDNAHAVHPNDVAKTDRLNKVYMNEGIVIKSNSNQAYTTDGLSLALFKAIMDKNNVKYQVFTNRSDVRGGSTLGAISLQMVTIPSVDIGLAQLAMHSCVETAGCDDILTLVKGMEAFFNTTIKKTKDGYDLK